MEKAPQEAMQNRIEAALDSSSVPHLYANGFVSTISNSDILVLLECGRKPVACLNMSYTTTKTLARNLSNLIKKFEEATEQNILTTDKVDEIMRQSP